MSVMPSWLEPMAATLTQDRFTGPEWIFVRKVEEAVRVRTGERGEIAG